MVGMSTDDATPINPAPRWLQWAPTLSRYVPIVAGGADDDPPADPPAGTAPGGATADQLTVLQAQIDAAAKTGGTQATAELAKTLGFDDIAGLKKFVGDQRAAIDQAKTEEQRRSDELATKEAAAAKREADAAALIRTGVIHMALIRAGVAHDAVEAAAPLVQLGDDLDDEAADAAVKAVKDNPAFASLFSATPPTGPASSVTGGTPKPGNKPAPTGDKEKSDALLDYLHPLPKTA